MQSTAYKTVTIREIETLFLRIGEKPTGKLNHLLRGTTKMMEYITLYSLSSTVISNGNRTAEFVIKHEVGWANSLASAYIDIAEKMAEKMKERADRITVPDTKLSTAGVILGFGASELISRVTLQASMCGI